MDDLIKQGAVAFKSGDIETARKLLNDAAKQFPDDERAWGWLYNVSTNDQDRISCLTQMLRINPKNEKATKLLDELSSLEPPLENPRSKNLEPITTPRSQNQNLTNQVTKQAILSKYVSFFIQSGFQLTSQSDATAQLIKPRRSTSILTPLLIVFVLPFVLYIFNAILLALVTFLLVSILDIIMFLVFMLRKEEAYFLNIDESGNIVVTDQNGKVQTISADKAANA